MTSPDLSLITKLQSLSTVLAFFEDHPLNHLYAFTVSKSYHEYIQTGLGVQMAARELETSRRRQPWVDQARELTSLMKELFTGDSSEVYWHAYQAKLRLGLQVNVTQRDELDLVTHGVLVPSHEKWLVIW